MWDLHYPPPADAARRIPISAVYRDTPSRPTGPVVVAGKDTLKLTAGGKAYEQPLEIKMDPRVTTPAAGLEKQYKLSMECYTAFADARTAAAEIGTVRKQLATVKAKADGLAAAIDWLGAKLAAVQAVPVGDQRPVRPRLREL